MNLNDRIRRQMNVDTLLGRLNLQRRRGPVARVALPALALASAAAMGWIGGLLLAPTTGRVQRRRLRARMIAGRDAAVEAVGSKIREIAG